MALWRKLGIVASCLLIAAGAVILVVHSVQARQPGQASSGSVTLSQAQLIEQQLNQAIPLNQQGSTKAALELYDKVLSEDPSNPAALAYAGFLQWNVGSTAHVASLVRIGRAEIETAIKDAPTYYQAHLFYGLVLENQDHNDAAAVAQFNDFLADGPPAAELPQAAPLVSGAYTGGRGCRCRRQFGTGSTTTTDHVSPVAPAGRRRRGERAGERAAVLVGRRPPDADPQGVAGVDAHRLEHGRRLDALRRAGGARVDGDAGPVQPDEDGLGLHAVHAEADQVGQPGLRRPGPTTSTPSTASAASTTEAICRRAAAASVVIAAPVFAGQRGRRGAEGEQGRERLEPGPAPAFLLAAHEQGIEPAATPDDQRTGAGHPSELVRADADQVGVERGEVHRDVPAGGGGVDVDGDAGLPAQRDHLVHRLERPDLVVGPLAVHQRRARAGNPTAGAPAAHRPRAAPRRRRRCPRWAPGAPRRHGPPSAPRRRRARAPPGPPASLPRRRR